MAALYSPETTVSSNEISTLSGLTFFSAQTVVSSNLMSAMTNVTRASAVCHMTSLDRNVTGAGTGGTATGASIASPIVMFLAGMHDIMLCLICSDVEQFFLSEYLNYGTAFKTTEPHPHPIPPSGGGGGRLCVSLSLCPRLYL